jgi:hypothetical protein
MHRITGSDIVRLMRKHGKTIRGLAGAMGITHKRVRQVRAEGVIGEHFVRDWIEAISGEPMVNQDQAA